MKDVMFAKPVVSTAKSSRSSSVTISVNVGTILDDLCAEMGMGPQNVIEVLICQAKLELRHFQKRFA